MPRRRRIPDAHIDTDDTNAIPAHWISRRSLTHDTPAMHIDELFELLPPRRRMSPSCTGGAISARPSATDPAHPVQTP